jgi:hypothetical protein
LRASRQLHTPCTQTPIEIPLDYVPRKTTSDVFFGKPILSFAPPVIRFTL